ncbi:DUF6266 family protein [Marinilabilia sp.]
MGRSNVGINGDFIGKIGNTIGSSWKGIYYMKGRSAPSSRKPTALQIEQRERFRFVSRFLQSIQPVVQIGFRDVEFKRSALNAALSDVMRNALEGMYPDFSIKYRNLSISRGALYAPSGCSVQAGEDQIDFTWEDDSGIEYVDGDDEVMLLAMSDDHRPLYSVGQYQRSTSAGALLARNVPSGTIFHCYLAMASRQNEMVTNSIYLGEITMP